MNQIAGQSSASAALPATPAAAAKASSLQVMRAVLWSFIGIRKRAGFENDVAKIKPLQLIVSGIIGAAVFVAALVTLVTFLTAK